MDAGASTRTRARSRRGRLTVASLRRSVVVSILFTLFGGPGILLVYLPYWITGFRTPAGPPVWQILAASVLMLIGLIPLLESIVRFVRLGRGTLMPTVPTERLVISGLYRYVRNPMYVGDLIVLIGETILFLSWDLGLYTVVVWLGFDLFIRLYEEPTLRRRHGEEYVRYYREVRRWWPRLTPA
jgi:protein-S-isoprenylcysteine O-methyltransferase Ste14